MKKIYWLPVHLQRITALLQLVGSKAELPTHSLSCIYLRMNASCSIQKKKKKKTLNLSETEGKGGGEANRQCTLSKPQPDSSPAPLMHH